MELAMSGNESIRDPLDRRFTGDVVVGKKQFDWLYGALAYDAASTVPAALGALLVLADRVRSGQTIWLFEPSTGEARKTDSTHALERWIERNLRSAAWINSKRI